MTHELVIQFLDAGQGDSIYIEFPDGETNMLIDMGTNGFGKSAAEKASLRHDSLFGWFKDNPNLLRDKGTLTCLILTHGDTDHYGLVFRFLEYCQAELAKPDWPDPRDQVKIGDVIFGGKRADYKQVLTDAVVYARKSRKPRPTNMIDFLESVYEARIIEDHLGPIVVLPATADRAAVRVMAVANNSLSRFDPGHARDGHVKNSDSLMVGIEYDGIKLLLSGDATVDTEVVTSIMGRIVPYVGDFITDIDVLKVPHHGSARLCNAVDFIQNLNPQMAFFTAGRKGTLGEGKATGHKLPNLAVFASLVNCPSMQPEGTEQHSLVMAYHPTSFGEGSSFIRRAERLTAEARKERAETPPAIDPFGALAGSSWVHVRTSLPIFGSIVQAGIEQGEADLGAQYQVVVQDRRHLTGGEKQIEVTMTDHILKDFDESVATPIQTRPSSMALDDDDDDNDARGSTTRKTKSRKRKQRAIEKRGLGDGDSTIRSGSVATKNRKAGTSATDAGRVVDSTVTSAPQWWVDKLETTTVTPLIDIEPET